MNCVIVQHYPINCFHNESKLFHQLSWLEGLKVGCKTGTGWSVSADQVLTLGSVGGLDVVVLVFVVGKFGSRIVTTGAGVGQVGRGWETGVIGCMI